MNPAKTALPVAAVLTIAAGDPKFVTSDPNGGWRDGDYYIHNNMWNSAKYSPCTSTLYAFAHDDWHVVTRMNNRNRDGAVKTYPNVHRDYASVPLASFSSITSTFAGTGPRVGIYNFAYDVWINGIAKPGCTEIMIWTDNFRQVPGGQHVQNLVFGGQAYEVYRNASTNYIAFVAATNVTSGTVDLLAMINWATARGWIPGKSTLNQICYGVEIVSTEDADATFQITAFSIDATLNPSPDGTGAPREAADSTRSRDRREPKAGRAD